MSEIKSLDDDEMQSNNSINYFIKHNDCEKLYSINKVNPSSFLKTIIENNDDNDNDNDDNAYGSKKNPILLKSISADTLSFVTKYINSCENEIPAPGNPLPENTHISAIFGNEWDIFSLIFDEKADPDNNYKFINNYILTSLYFDLPELTKKLCSMVAYVLRSDNRFNQ